MSDETPEDWARAFLETVDGGDLARLGALLTKDIRLVSGNQPTIEGREAVLDAFRDVSGKATTRHEVSGVWTGRDREFDVVSIEAAVTYTLADGRVVPLPVTSTLRRRDGLVADYRIFMDAAPAFGTSADGGPQTK